MSISDRFPSLNPIAIRAAPMREVILLASRLIDSQKRRNRAKKREKWRPAGDNWF